METPPREVARTRTHPSDPKIDAVANTPFVMAEMTKALGYGMECHETVCSNPVCCTVELLSHLS